MAIVSFPVPPVERLGDLPPLFTSFLVTLETSVKLLALFQLTTFTLNLTPPRGDQGLGFLAGCC